MAIYLFSQIQKFTKYSIKLIEKLSRRHLIDSSDVFFIKGFTVYKLLRMGITKHDILGYTTEDQYIAIVIEDYQEKRRNFVAIRVIREWGIAPLLENKGRVGRVTLQKDNYARIMDRRKIVTKYFQELLTVDYTTQNYKAEFYLPPPPPRKIS